MFDPDPTRAPGKTIVITGSSRGIGLGLARAFLQRGCHVVISARNKEGLDASAHTLRSEYPDLTVLHFPCDIVQPDELKSLWKFAHSKLGKIDFWINNAGISLPTKMLWEHDANDLSRIIDINFKGMMLASRVAVKGMLKQGFGQVYNMEGFGSDGRIMRGMTPYGSTKASVAYLTRAMAKECKNTCVSISALSPGMVVTDLLLGDMDPSAAGYQKATRIFNILADRVDTVTPWLVECILKGPRNGGGFRWLTTPKIIFRFLRAPFIDRDVLS